MSTPGAVATQPRLHRLCRRLGLYGVKGCRTAWRAAEQVVPWPAGDLVEVWPGITIVNDPRDYIAAGVYRGLYERIEVRLLPRLCPAGGFAVDVGANVGYHTAVLSQLAGTNGRVAAFEPAPWCLERLRALVDHVPLANVELHPCAVGAAPGTALLQDPEGPTHSGLSTLRTTVSDVTNSVEVQVVALADIPDVCDREIDVIKIDVEGFEAAVLAGAAPIFAEHRVRFAIVEVSPQFGPVEYAADLVRSLGDSYRAYAIEETGALVRKPLLRLLTADAVGAAPAQFNLLLARRDGLPALHGLTEPAVG